MTNEEKFQLCQERAREIVEAYRVQAPQGFDPKNTWGVVAGTVISAASAAIAAKQRSDANKKAAAAQQAALKGTGAKGGIQGLTPTLLGDKALSNLNEGGQAALNFNTNNTNVAKSGHITGYANQYNVGQAQKYYQQIQPHFKQLQEQIGANAQSFASGQLPQDTVASIGRAAAQRGIEGGYGFGSQGASGGMLGNLNLRNLGLTSLDLTKYGTQLGMQVNQSAKALTPNLMQIQDNYITPQMALQNQQFNAHAALTDNMSVNAANAQNVALQNSMVQSQANQAYQQAQTQGAQNAAYTQAAGQIGSAAAGGIADYYKTNSAGTDQSTGLQNNGFYNSAGAAQSAYGSGAHILDNGGGNFYSDMNLS